MFINMILTLIDIHLYINYSRFFEKHLFLIHYLEPHHLISIEELQREISWLFLKFNHIKSYDDTEINSAR